MTKPYRVLLVEDNEELRVLYKEGFSRHNFEVIEAENGEVAIDLALTRQPDAVILDLLLPRQGGIGALRIIRSLPEIRNIPVLILTALNDPRYREITQDMVQGYYLKTQVKPLELIKKTRELIDESKNILD